MHSFNSRNAISPSFQTKCHSNEEAVSIQVQNEKIIDSNPNFYDNDTNSRTLIG